MDRRAFIAGLSALLASAAQADAQDAEMKPKILFTGFKPWSDNPHTNISEDMLLAFQPELEATGVEVQFLDVSYKAIDAFLETFDPDEYDYIVNFGVDTREDARAITVESQAANRRYFPDDSGDCPMRLAHSHGGCVNDGRDASQPGEIIYASPMLLDLAHAPVFESLDIERLGTTPQQFLCAYLFYHMTLNVDPSKTENAFVHLGWKDNGDQAKFILGLADEIVKAHELRVKNDNRPVMQYNQFPTITYDSMGERKL